MKNEAWLLIISVFCVLIPQVIMAQDTTAKAVVWMYPPGVSNGQCFRELFTHPDQWKETRSKIDVLGYWDIQLDKQFTDDELSEWFAMLDKWGLKFTLEVGAVKMWAPKGKAAYYSGLARWKRFMKLGCKIYAFALDEPFCCVRKEMNESFEYAVEQTAQFIAKVRERYPDILIGDIEPYPFFRLDELIDWIDSLQARLKELNVRGMDFFRLDVNWAGIIYGGESGSWEEVKKLEDACRGRKIPFSLIYWASDYPYWKSKNNASDGTWYDGVMKQGDYYEAVGGTPDQYVIESWVGAPSRSVPETDEWSFTRSVLDFCDKFVKRKKIH